MESAAGGEVTDAHEAPAMGLSVTISSAHVETVKGGFSATEFLLISLTNEDGEELTELDKIKEMHVQASLRKTLFKAIKETATWNLLKHGHATMTFSKYDKPHTPRGLQSILIPTPLQISV